MRILLALSTVAVAVIALTASAHSADKAGNRSAVTVRDSRFGPVLFDGKGFVLYAFTKDPRGKSVCSGGCATAWPPFIVKAQATAGKGVQSRLIGTTRRADGRIQLTYAGRPLYYYVGDRSPGLILCQDVDEFGGTWLVARADGKLVR
jgi:predicted lipoprotein with Yx(FWY)xxD motif